MRRLSPSDRERIIAQYASGASVGRIAIGFEVTEDTIYRTLRKAGVEMRDDRRRGKDERDAQVLKRFRLRVPVARIAQELDVSRQHVNQILREHDCQPRGRARMAYGGGIGDRPSRADPARKTHIEATVLGLYGEGESIARIAKMSGLPCGTMVYRILHRAGRQPDRMRAKA